MSERLRVGLSGLGGYGGHYLKYLLDSSRSGFEFVGGIDPAPERCERLPELKERGVPVYPSLDGLYAQGACDVLITVAPPHLHADQTCHALDKDSAVLCEKPLCPTVQESQRMIDCREKNRKPVAIGYQWSFSTAITNLKADIRKGRFGAPRRLRTLVLWPRATAYYARNGWAARTRLSNGRWVLDSPVTNATAHFLHNMLYVLGPSASRSAQPRTVRAELYRANAIDNYDTAALRCTTDSGAELLFYSTHAPQNQYGPVFDYEFEGAVVRYRGEDIVATLATGEQISYGQPESEPHNKVENILAAARDEGEIVCGIEAALPHVKVTNGAQESAPIADFPREMIRTETTASSERVWVEGLDEAFNTCYATGALPSENKLPWAHEGREIDLRDYVEFPALGR